MAPLFDIGFNATDPVFRGIYHGHNGKPSHEDDFDHVLKRAQRYGCTKMMVTGGDLADARGAMELAAKYPGVLYSTVGTHPTHAQAFDKHPEGPEDYLKELEKLAKEGKQKGAIIAFGEFGLDYDRLDWCPKDVQLKYFKQQLELATTLDLPLFLHSRACAEDFESILFPMLPRLPRGGVVHSFTGSIEEMQRLVAKGLYISVNGCSMKTEEQLDMVKEIPLEYLMLETDAPWCGLKTSTVGKYLKEAPEMPQIRKKEKFVLGDMTKSRNEPCTMIHVATVVAALKGISVEELTKIAWENTMKVFLPNEYLELPN
ncbi:hypothetical protein YB2330_002800 [Saitoella coloradoensis]